MNDLIQKGFILFGYKFTYLEIVKVIYEKQNVYFSVNCVRDRSGKPTAPCSASGMVRGLETDSPTRQVKCLEKSKLCSGECPKINLEK